MQPETSVSTVISTPAIQPTFSEVEAAQTLDSAQSTQQDVNMEDAPKVNPEPIEIGDEFIF